jgi:tetratricopeptide (TPR) repeat protein
MTRRIDRIIRIRLVGLILVTGVLLWGGCGSSPQVREKPGADRNLEQFIKAARQAFDKGQIEQAASLYRKVLERALVRDDSDAIVDAQYNLAVCLMKLNSNVEAMQVVRQAEAELALSDQKKLPELLLLKAMFYYKSAELDEAWQITEQILSMTPKPSTVILGRTHFLRGLIASERGDINQLRDEVAALGNAENPLLRGDLAELKGYLALAEQDWGAALQAFDEAVILRRLAIDYQGMMKNLALAAEASEKAGNIKAASQRYLRAGRSAALQGDYDTAKPWLTHAEQLAGEAGENQVAHEARLYLDQIQEANKSIQ